MTDTLMPLWTTQLAQLTIAILIVGVVTCLFCRRRPQVAYALWLVVLVKCLLPPVWPSRTGVFSWMQGSTANSSFHSQPAPSSDVAPAARGEAPASPIASMSGQPRQHTRPGEPVRPRASSTSCEGPDWFATAAGLYVAGAAVMLLACLGGSLRIRRNILRARAETPPHVQAIFDEVTTCLSHSETPAPEPVPLIVSRQEIGPALAGFFRPVIVIPESLARSTTDLRPIFAHELLHYRRRDHWVGLLQLLVAAAWWFHPLVWWMNRQVSRAREMSCDEQAIASLACPPADYGQMLVNVMKLGRRPTLAPTFALGVRSAHITARRLEHIVNNATQFHPRVPWPCYLWIALAALTLLPGARHVAAQNELAAAAAPDGGKGRTFTGVVIDKTTKAPIAGATVTLSRELAVQPEKWDVISKQDLKTDAAGKFEFTLTTEEMTKKHFCLATEAKHPNYTDLPWEGEGLSLTLDKEKKGEQPWFLKLEMSPGEAVSGTIQDPQGKPLANCPVVYRSTEGDEQQAGLKMGNEIAMGTVKTDAAGRFSFNVIKGTTLNHFSAQPEAYAVLSESFGAKRGDLGAFRLSPGQRISGTVVDADGKPRAGVPVRAQSDKRILIEHATERDTKTDAAGKFELAPVEADAYQVTVMEEGYLPVKVNVASDVAPAAIDFRPPPMNTIRVRFVDSSGKPSQKRNRVSVSAFKNGIWYHTNHKGDGAQAELRVPEGMENTQLSIMGYHDQVMVWRLGNVGDWRRGDSVTLGMLREPVTDVTVMSYKQPKLIVRAVDPDGNPVADFKPMLTYTDEALRMPSAQFWHNGIKGDVGFEPADDKKGWVSGSMLIPNRELNLWVDADGMHGSQMLTMKEGEQREVTVTIKRRPKQ